MHLGQEIYISQKLSKSTKKTSIRFRVKCFLMRFLHTINKYQSKSLNPDLK